MSNGDLWVIWCGLAWMAAIGFVCLFVHCAVKGGRRGDV